jgi:hypothetical protein
LWLFSEVSEWIAHRYAIRLQVRTVGKYLKRWGDTPQKLLKKTSGQSLDQSVAAVSSFHQDGFAIGAAIPLIEARNDGLGKKSLGITGTVSCYLQTHGKPFLFLQTLTRQHVCSRRGFSRLQLSRMFPG